ncbi:MAG: TrkH family potassium uptake protein, partial [Alphaproteobacteria bacterium]|nr:TrkH family potassium uptake protein [Alphaproteobacteria bacterium]
RPVLFVVGLLLLALAGAMLVPGVVELASGTPDWRAFGFAAAATLFVGGALVLATFAERARLGLRQAFLTTALCWLVAAVFASLPFVLMQVPLSFTDAFFEAMSGITTTGSTVMIGLDHAPPGILLWRALLQWFGGIGIIVTALAVLPMLQVGGMQLFRMESSDRSDKAFPRTAQLAAWIAIVYGAMTLLWSAMLWAAGMTLFDAIAHAMTTIATGGFSTSDKSVGAYPDPLIHWLITVGMIAGSLPFVLYLQAVRGQVRPFFRDTQVRWFLGTLGVIILALTLGQLAFTAEDFGTALHLSAFNATSIMTGTGYATSEYDHWGSFAPAMFFVIMFLGGCAGSTTCGIKIFRFQILFGAAIVQLKQLLQPRGVFIAYYNRRPISPEVVGSVMAFSLVYAAGFATLAIALSFMGLDFITCMSGAATAISNVGPGLGEIIGPAGTFVALPVGAKWALAIGMLFGRLEFFTILVLFLPNFWRG